MTIFTFYFTVNILTYVVNLFIFIFWKKLSTT